MNARQPRSTGAATLALGVLADAAPPFGLFATADARREGVSEDMLRSLVRSGHLRRPARGWYHLADPEHDALALHRRATAAHVLRRRGRAVASHHSALIDHGVPALGAHRGTVHLTHRDSSSYRVGRGWVVHRADTSTAALDGDPGAAAVGLPFAIVQSGLLNGPLATLVAGDSALGRRLVTPEDLASAAAAYGRTTGIAAVTGILAHLSELAESPAESLARYAVTRLGYAVTPQRWVRSEDRDYRVDLAVDDTPLLIEVDGWVKYQGPDGSQVIMDEKARHASLERSGWKVLRLTWREVMTSGGQLRLANIRALIQATLRAPAA